MSSIFSRAVVFLQQFFQRFCVINFHAGVLLKNNIAEEFLITGYAFNFHCLLFQSMDRV